MFGMRGSVRIAAFELRSQACQHRTFSMMVTQMQKQSQNRIPHPG